MVEPTRQTFVVERRAICRGPLTLRLPYPPSAGNSALPPGETASGRYRSWYERAALSLPRTRARLSGPVEVVMTFKEHSARQHFDRISKTVLSFLAERGVIDDELARTVRKVVLCWGPTDGVVVEVRPVEPIAVPSR
jgi:hypothetical protein